jgi:basic membrane protein A
MIQSVETSKATDGGKVYFIDVIGDKSSIDKGGLLSSVIWDITPVYTAMIQDLRDGKFGTYEYSIKLADNSVRLLKTSHIPDKVWNELEAIRGDIVSGKIKVEPHFDAAAVHALVTEVAVAK